MSRYNVFSFGACCAPNPVDRPNEYFLWSAKHNPKFNPNALAIARAEGKRPPQPKAPKRKRGK